MNYLRKSLAKGSKTRLDETVPQHTYLLLFHELRIGAIVDDITSEHGSGQRSIDLLGVDVLELAVQNEIIARGADRDGGLLAEKNEGEDVTKLHGRTD